MKIAQAILDEPNANPVAGLGVRVRRKSDGVTLATVTTDANGICRIEGDGHYPPFTLETTNQIGGPRLWNSDDTIAAGAFAPAEVPYALRAFGDGYIPGYLNQLAVSLNSTTLSLATGGALVAGYPVINYTADSFSLSRPSSGTRVDRLVVRVYGSAHADHGKAEFAILSGSVGGGSPSLTQTTSVYEVALASVSVPSAGSLTLTDERVTVLGTFARKAPVTGVARSSSVSTSDTGGEAMLSLDLSLTENTTYDIDAEFGGYQASATSTTYPWEISFGSYGSGTSNFNNPGQIARDSSGNLYVADTANNRLKKHDSSGTYVTSITGLTGIRGVCVDGSNNVYISALSGTTLTLKKYNSSLTQQWSTTVVCNLTSGCHLFTDNTNLYVIGADFSVYTMYRRLCSTGASAGSSYGYTVGSGAFQLNAPQGVAYDGTSIYIVDQANKRIQKAAASNPAAITSTWGASGTGDGQFTTPVGIAVNPVSGNIFVTDTGRDDVQEFTNTGTFVGRFGTLGSSDGQLNNPTGVVVSADGADVYVAESGNNRVQRFNTGTVVGGYGEVAVSIDGNLSAYVGMGVLNGAIGNAHTRSVSGPATVTVAGYAKATADTLTLTSCVLSARAVPRL